MFSHDLVHIFLLKALFNTETSKIQNRVSLLYGYHKSSNSDKKIFTCMVLFDFCFKALQHILGHFGRGQLP